MQRFRLDQMAIILSSLCMIHCIASVVGLFCYWAVVCIWAYGRSVSHDGAGDYRACECRGYCGGLPASSPPSGVGAGGVGIGGIVSVNRV